MKSLTLIGVNGDSIPLELELTSDFTVNGQAGGLGFLAQQFASIEGAGDGKTVRNVRTPSRQIDIPVRMFAADEAGINLVQRRLTAAMRWRPGMTMPRLVVELDDGSYFLEVLLVTPSMMDADHFAEWSTWLFTFEAPQPHWQAVDAVNLPVYGQAPVDPLLPNLLPDVSLSSASVLGAVEVDNPGTEDAPVVWIVTGPFTSCTITLADGRSWSLGAVVGGTTITVDTRKPKRVTDQTGANQYGLLGPAPKLFHLPPGESLVDINVVGATSATSVSGYYYTRFGAIF